MKIGGFTDTQKKGYDPNMPWGKGNTVVESRLNSGGDRAFKGKRGKVAMKGSSKGMKY